MGPLRSKRMVSDMARSLPEMRGAAYVFAWAHARRRRVGVESRHFPKELVMPTPARVVVVPGEPVRCRSTKSICPIPALPGRREAVRERHLPLAAAPDAPPALGTAQILGHESTGVVIARARTSPTSKKATTSWSPGCRATVEHASRRADASSLDLPNGVTAMSAERLHLGRQHDRRRAVRREVPSDTRRGRHGDHRLRGHDRRRARSTTRPA